MQKMESQNREVTLKLKSRPLRCAYLIRDREELLDAITLYTHVWGGAANAIFPMPISDEEINSLKFILELMNADYVFIPRDELSHQDEENLILESMNGNYVFTPRDRLPNQLSQVLNNLPILQRPISRQEVEQHINASRRDLLRLRDGSLSHIQQILIAKHSSPLEESTIRLLDATDPFRVEIALHEGLPSLAYREYLREYLGAKTISQPENTEQLLKAFLVTTKRYNPCKVTLINTGKNADGFNRYITETTDAKTLCLFLDDGEDLGIATAFWNLKWFHPENRVFLPRREFLENSSSHVRQIIEFMPYIRAVNIMTPLDRQEALELYSRIRSSFLEVEREILVKIYYGDFRFDWLPGTLSLGKPADFTRAVTSENGVRFTPVAPIGHENTDFAFGYDSEVSFVSGRRFFSPKTLMSSRLLANELWRLEYAEENRDELGENWLRQGLPARAATKGVSGVALPNRECSFFIHSDEVVITQQLKEVGFKVRPNEHTRYAQGLVKRLGGIEKVANLLRQGGADIISVLVVDRANQVGLFEDDIKSNLIRKRNYNHQAAQKIIKQKLKPLLASDLLRRGYCYQCPTCNLKSWLSLEELSEFIECKGCAEREQMPLDEMKFSYKPNELAAQLVGQGGLAVLMTASTLRQTLSSSSGFIQFGGDFLRMDNSKSSEIDLFWLTEAGLVISECKSIFESQKGEESEKHKTQEKIERTKESLRKNLEVAKRINAVAVVLGIFTNLPDISNLIAIITELAEVAQSDKIGLHLVVNEKLYLWGEPDVVDLRRTRLYDLLVDEEYLSDESSVGESPRSYGGEVGANGFYSSETFKRWEAELRTQAEA